MRKLSIFTLLAFLMVSCGGNLLNFGNSNSEYVESEGDVFSNAYDGFLNIREYPSAKSYKIGELKNGPKGATLIDYGPKWSKISHGGVEGYVKTEYLQTSPTKPVYVNPEDAIGVWGESEGEYAHSHDILVFDNGTYAIYNTHFCEGAFTAVGKWKLEENSIILTEYYDLVFNLGNTEGGKGLKSNSISSFEVDKEGKMELISDVQVARETEEGYTPIWSQSQLDEAKADIKWYFK